MKMSRIIRNRHCVPKLSDEGVYLKSLNPANYRGDGWYRGLAPHERMHAHQTLASARRFAYFQPFPNLIPNDELDFILAANYNQSIENFIEPIDVYIQSETMGVATWRTLRNTRPLRPARDVREKAIVNAIKKKKSIDIPYRYDQIHPVLIGGIVNKTHPSSVKLMNSSHHSPQTNAGYSRQDSDGTLFQY